MHTGCKSRGGGGSVAQGFAKIPGGSSLSGKIVWGRGGAYFGFYCIFIKESIEICLGLPIFSLTPHPLPCVRLWITSTYCSKLNLFRLRWNSPDRNLDIEESLMRTTQSENMKEWLDSTKVWPNDSFFCIFTAQLK